MGRDGRAASRRRGLLGLAAALAAAASLVAGCGGDDGASERAAVRESVEGYFDALAAREFDTACAHTTPRFRTALEQWSRRNQPDLAVRTCPAIADRIAADAGGRLVELQRRVRVRSVEVDGERARAVFGANQVAELERIEERWLIDELDFTGAAR